MKPLWVVLLILFSMHMVADDYHWEFTDVIGNTSDDLGKDIAYDNQGNVYFTGMFKYSITLGGETYYSEGSEDIFVIKYDPDGVVQWVQTAGSDDWDEVTDIKVDASGNIYICGGIRPDCYFGNHHIVGNGQFDVFVAKLTPVGEWAWVKSTGSDQMDAAYDIDIDAVGNIYLIGYFMQTINFGQHQLTSLGGYDIFVTKLDTSGDFSWALSAGGSNTDTGFSIAVNDNITSNETDIIVSGYYRNGCNFGQFQPTCEGEYDLFYAKVSETNGWEWVKNSGSTGRDYCYGIEFDSAANIYIAGGFHASMSFADISLNSTGLYDAYLMKLDTDGNYLWSRSIGGLGNEQLYKIAVDNQNNVYAAGYAGANAVVSDSLTGPADNSQGFIVKYDSEGLVRLFGVVDPVNGLVDNTSGRLTCRGIDINDNLDIAVAGTIDEAAYFDGNMEHSHGLLDAFCSQFTQRVISNDNPGIEYSNIRLSANVPNPFNPETRIEYSIPADGLVNMEIFNIRGQKIRTMVNQHIEKGDHFVIWNGKDKYGNSCSSGVYFYRLSYGNTSKTRKMALIK